MYGYGMGTLLMVLIRKMSVLSMPTQLYDILCSTLSIWYLYNNDVLISNKLSLLLKVFNN